MAKPSEPWNIRPAKKRATVPASIDVKWDEADPTYSLEAAKRGG